MVALLGLPSLARAQAGGAGEAAFRHVVMLAGTVGPRKSGGEAEGRAIEYVAAAMEKAGLAVTREPVDVVPFADGERSVRSVNLIGELPGAVRDTVVLAAHHDSRNASVPGANDDASGVAVLLEAARLTAARPHRLTYRFISFCAEEEGLLGSRDYVAHADLSPVRLMIALEMMGRGELIVAPVPRPPALWAQRLLLRAAEETGARGVAARPLWTLAPRILDLPFSSDHEPFLERHVPAFLLLGTFPAWAYHSTEDTVDGVRPEALERAVRVVDRLLQDLEVAPPSTSDDPHFLPLMLFGRGLLIPSNALLVVSGASLLLLSLLVLYRLRDIARPRAIGETIRVLIVTGASTAIGLSGLLLSEATLERIHRARHPWFAHQGLHVAQGIVWGLFTSWIGLNLFRRIKPTVEPGPYLAAASLIPGAWVAAGLRFGYPELSVIMAPPLVLFLASLRFESTGRKLALGLGALLPFCLLLPLRDYKTLIDLGGVAPTSPQLFAALLLIALPPALFLAHVASFHDCLHSRVWWWLSGRRVGLALLLASLVLLGVNAILPPYDDHNRQVVQLRERVDLDARRAAATFHSDDLLRGVRLVGLNRRRLDPDGTTQRFDLPFPASGIEFAAEVSPSAGGGEALVTTRLSAPIATDRISYLFSSRSGFRVAGGDGEMHHRYTFIEFAPRRDPTGSFRLTLPAAGDLSVELKADFADDLLGLRPESDRPSVFQAQGTIEGSRHLLGPAPARRAADEAAPAR